MAHVSPRGSVHLMATLRQVYRVSALHLAEALSAVIRVQAAKAAKGTSMIRSKIVAALVGVVGLASSVAAMPQTAHAEALPQAMADRLDDQALEFTQSAASQRRHMMIEEQMRAQRGDQRRPASEPRREYRAPQDYGRPRGYGPRDEDRSRGYGPRDDRSRGYGPRDDYRPRY